MMAVPSESYKVVQLLPAIEANVNAAMENGFTPQAQATENGHHEMIRLLLDHGADVNAALKEPGMPGNGRTALMRAAGHGLLNIVRLLIRYGANVGATQYDAGNCSGYSALTYAVQEDHRQVVCLLLAKGADANVTTADGSTALMMADENSDEATVTELPDHHDRVDACYRDQRPSSCHWFAGQGGKP